MPYQGRELAFKLGLEGNWFSSSPKSSWAWRPFSWSATGADRNQPAGHYQTGRSDLPDGKLGADGNALFRQPDLREIVTSRRKIRVKHKLHSGN